MDNYDWNFFRYDSLFRHRLSQFELNQIQVEVSESLGLGHVYFFNQPQIEFSFQFKEIRKTGACGLTCQRHLTTWNGNQSA